MSAVAILTPDPATGDHAEVWPPVLARLQSALAAQGIRAVPAPWSAHVEDASALDGYAQVLPLLVWNYHVDHARWLRACRTWAQAGLPMANPPSVLAWNSDKRYLDRLAAAGVAIPHTAWTRRLTRTLLEQVFDATGADELIAKPAVSGGAWKTWRFGRDGIDALLAQAGSDADDDAGRAGVAEILVQPFLPTILQHGETSLLYFGGRLSHAVNKRPTPGDFRVQETFGGHYTALAQPPAGALALAEQVLAAIDEPLLYARIDMVPDADGRWLLMEAELIEPDFYLGVDPGRGALFAQALRDRLEALPAPRAATGAVGAASAP
ncbi:hypothetical protein [Luteimonas sp. MC1895]|uniref:ATP-grasp domain-containing protein n=1 Tax=Luteimonas sp. MC1895 TaxID=2819513 RepID=UPI0018F0AF38|nr:hypothetical protein [Luteimonas sp. MC1895]MBJ6978810.1 hypothetical protein [Luteimonas sp. MC1895]